MSQQVDPDTAGAETGPHEDDVNTTERAISPTVSTPQRANPDAVQAETSPCSNVNYTELTTHGVAIPGTIPHMNITSMEGTISSTEVMSLRAETATEQSSTVPCIQEKTVVEVIDLTNTSTDKAPAIAQAITEPHTQEGGGMPAMPTKILFSFAASTQASPKGRSKVKASPTIAKLLLGLNAKNHELGMSVLENPPSDSSQIFSIKIGNAQEGNTDGGQEPPTICSR